MHTCSCRHPPPVKHITRRVRSGTGLVITRQYPRSIPLYREAFSRSIGRKSAAFGRKIDPDRTVESLGRGRHVVFFLNRFSQWSIKPVVKSCEVLLSFSSLFSLNIKLSFIERQAVCSIFYWQLTLRTLLRNNIDETFGLEKPRNKFEEWCIIFIMFLGGVI